MVPQGLPLALIALLACLAALQWAREVFVPLLLGLLLSYALTPLVRQMVRLRLPRALAAALLLAGLTGAVGGIAYTLADDAAEMIEALPDVAQKVRRSLERQRNQGPVAAIEKVQQAASEIERAAEEGARGSPAPSHGVTKVQIERPRFSIKDYLWPSTVGLVTMAGQATLVLFLTFFLLAAGDSFRRKVVKIAGPGFGQKRLTLQALDEIDLQVQRYLLVQVATSALVGVVTWLVFWWIGVEHAAVWGVVSFVLNFVPYLGSLIVAGASAVMGFVQFGTVEMALLIGGAVMVINLIEGNVLTPWLNGRTARMNPVAVFVGVLAWGWLWGAWGLFLAMPILMAIKAVCERVDGLGPVAELLGD